MERLTEWDETNNRWHIVDSVGKWDLKDAVDRLAAYENLGLAPDEIALQLSTYSCLLCDVTHSRMSKTNYTLDAIRSCIEDVQEMECEECERASDAAVSKRVSHILKALYVVACVDYIAEDAQAPVVYIFDNEHSANQCMEFLSNKNNIVTMTKEEVYGSFCVGGQT